MQSRTEEASTMAARLKHVESLTGGLARRRAEPETIPQDEAPVGLVPVPRRSRIFLRHGKDRRKGPGEFADLTLTAPIVRAYLT